MKGHLSEEQLKEYSYKELQELAKNMGVSASGKSEEIIARITAVEVDVPDKSELTEAEKAEAEQAAKAAAEKEAAEQAAKAAAEKAAGKVRVEATTRYLDKQLNEIKEAGEIFTADKERAAELVAAKVAKIKE